MTQCIQCMEDRDNGGVGFPLRKGKGYRFMCWQCYNTAEGRKLYDNIEDAKRGMELQEREESNQCLFDLAWIGYCKKPGWPYCGEHSMEKCCVCGEQATHQCPETLQFVCGYPLCDKHTHKGMYGHG